MTESSEPTAQVGAQFLKHIQCILAGLQNGDIPFSDEITPLREQIDKHLTEANASHLMESRYRCTTCFHEWKLFNELADARDCSECGAKTIEPYTVLDGSGSDAPLYALVEHEKRYPNPNLTGDYRVEVVRTGYRIAEIEVSAIGPASAEWEALIKAPDHAFSSDYSSDYEAQNVEQVTTAEPA